MVDKQAPISLGELEQKLLLAERLRDCQARTAAMKSLQSKPSPDSGLQIADAYEIATLTGIPEIFLDEAFERGLPSVSKQIGHVQDLAAQMTPHLFEETIREIYTRALMAELQPQFNEERYKVGFDCSDYYKGLDTKVCFYAMEYGSTQELWQKSGVHGLFFTPEVEGRKDAVLRLNFEIVQGLRGKRSCKIELLELGELIIESDNSLFDYKITIQDARLGQAAHAVLDSVDRSLGNLFKRRETTQDYVDTITPETQ